MIKTLKFILRSQIIGSKVFKKESGFTLIELLVGIIIAFLVITPLLGFMINVLTTDRQEQAKASSEQEIQTALDYISRDLQQAIYIYDQAGITAIQSQLFNAGTDRVPVLVFWKREVINQVLPTASGSDDAFVYSLVVYYLMKDNSSTWSNAARIARWQIKDGVRTSSTDASTTTTCGNYSAIPNTNPAQYTSYIKGNCPDQGYKTFAFNDYDTLLQGMNGWQKDSSGYDSTKTSSNVTTKATPVPSVLLDYIDQTTTGAPTPPTCPANSTKVPPANFNGGAVSSMTSFYACVDQNTTTAQVFIRGNALARIKNNASLINYADSKKTYFPTASIRVQGRGYLFR